MKNKFWLKVANFVGLYILLHILISSFLGYIGALLTAATFWDIFWFMVVGLPVIEICLIAVVQFVLWIFDLG